MRLHETCTTDQAAPRFDHEWQRRAFGLAVALAEFGHYKWDEFQQSLIQTISRWDNTPESQRGEWHYYDHWVTALEKVIADHRLLSAPVAKDAGDQHRDAPTQWRELVAVMPRQPDDERPAFEPAQVVTGLPAGVGAAQQGGDDPDQGRVVEPGD
ncbi:nitrile hydratase accessory protein [Mycobacterium sp.]|uniref:nitrile hydratase accessory protein n=1 Tax=Mycobacterium sp. TaxID=1785 RepID=UPI003BB6C5DD